MSSTEVVRDAQSAENYNPLAKQKAAAKLSRIPVKVVQGESRAVSFWPRACAVSFQVVETPIVERSTVWSPA